MRYSNRPKIDPVAFDAGKERLNAAFKELRSLGMLARQSAGHCNSCSEALLTPIIDARASKGKPYTGVVYYHTQDADHMRESGYVYLNYSTSDTNSSTPNDMDVWKAIGRQVVEVMEKHNLPTTWDGNVGTKVRVELCPLLAETPKETPTPEFVPQEFTTVDTSDVTKPGGTIANASDGNIYSIAGYVRVKLRRAGNSKEIIDRFSSEVQNAHSFDDAVQISMAYLGEGE